MPELDGLSATRKIREYEAHFPGKRSRPVPIIALTANVSESDQADCRLSGMDGFLPKPLQINGQSIFFLVLESSRLKCIGSYIFAVLKSTLHTFLG
jgi:CheY-like chemotaxis protein